MINAQFKKGVLELCVMALLAQKAHYGYELVEKISETIEISEGTIYPLLKRLKDDGFVTTYLEESASGAPRKYYTLTPEGEKVRKSITEEWVSFTERVNTFLKKDNNEKK
jgi:PadR family transcriptional regulator, regulatory protein PadR